MISHGTAPSWGTRLLGIEGLRGVAAITVLMAHVDSHLADGVRFGGISGVLGLLTQGLTLFFSLSGFLLYRPFAMGIITGSRFPNVPRFLLNRVLRIFPAYWVILILVSLVLGVAYTEPLQPDASSEGAVEGVGYLTDPVLLLLNGSMLQTFFPISIKTGLGVAWTLTVEFVFYLVLPLLAILAFRVSRVVSWRRLAPFIPVLVMFAIGIVGKVLVALLLPAGSNDYYLHWGGNWFAVLARSFVAHADLFAFGMLAAVIVSIYSSGTGPMRGLQAVRWSALGVGVIAGLTARILGDFSDTCYALAFGCLILFVVLPARQGATGLLSRSLELAPIKYTGLVSYSLYLWHLPVIWLLARYQLVAPATVWGYWANCGIVLAGSLALASATYFLVEKPALKLKRRTDAGSVETPDLTRSRQLPATD